MSDLKVLCAHIKPSGLKPMSGHWLLEHIHTYTCLDIGYWYNFSRNTSTWSSLQTPRSKKCSIFTNKGKKTLPLVSALVCTECWNKVKNLILIFHSFPGLHTKYLKPLLKNCVLTVFHLNPQTHCFHLSVGKGLLSVSQPEIHTEIRINIFCCCSSPMQQEAERNS